MQNLLDKDDLIDFLTSKYKLAQTNFEINIAFLKGEQKLVNDMKNLDDVLEVSKKIALYHERFGYSLGQVELILDLVKKINNG